MTLYIQVCRFDDEGAKEKAAKLEEENAALKERLAKALDAATHPSGVGSTAIATAVGNGVAQYCVALGAATRAHGEAVRVAHLQSQLAK